MRRRRIMLALGLIALVAALAIAIVLAVSGGRHSKPRTARAEGSASPAADLVAAAGYLGLSVSQLRGELRGGKTLAEVADTKPGKSPAGLEEALVSAKSKRIEAALARGTLSPVQERARLRAVRRRARAELRRSRARLRGGRADTIAAASYLDVPAAQLVAEVRSGHSLAQIASSKAGSSKTGLIDALVTERKKVILAAAASGRISHTTETKLLTTLSKRVTLEVETP